MVKYANSDIRDGINSLKIGVGNIISSIQRGVLTEYTVPHPLNYLIIVGALRELFDTALYTYSDKFISMKVEGIEIDIVFNTADTHFSLKT